MATLVNYTCKSFIKLAPGLVTLPVSPQQESLQAGYAFKGMKRRKRRFSRVSPRKFKTVK